MKPDRTSDRGAEPEFEQTWPFPSRGVALAACALFALIALVPGIVSRPEAIALFVVAAFTAPNGRRGSVAGIPQ